MRAFGLMIVAITVFAAPLSAQRLPAHAHAAETRRGAGWACDDGFVQRGPRCVSVRVATDAEIRRAIIASSLADYPGNCPCPWNVDRAGRSCGRRSAWSRPGGYSPKCYPSDVSGAEVREYRERYGPHRG